MSVTTSPRHQGRDHHHDVGDHLQHLVEQPAPVAGGEAERHPDQRRAQRPERPDQVALPEPDDQLGEHIMAEVVGTQPVLPRRRLAGQEVVGGVVRRDQRPG
jgi:hypothetical protein